MRVPHHSVVTGQMPFLPPNQQHQCTEGNNALKALKNHYIFMLWLLLSSFFPRLISAVGDWMSAILLHIPSVNLECRSEMCCTWLAETTGCKKVAKNRHLGTIAQLCRATSSQLRHVSTIGKKLVKQQYVLQMSAQYGELPIFGRATIMLGIGPHF